MSLLNDAFEWLTKNAKPRVVVLDREPRHVYGVVQPDGAVIRTEAEPDPRHYQVLSPVAMCEAVADLQWDDVVLFVGKKQVVALAKESSTRRERVTLPLVLTDQFVALQLCQNRQKFDQEEFVELLTIKLHGTGAESYAPIFRKLNFTRNDEGGSDLTNTKKQVKRSHLAQISGAETIPETIRLELFAYDTLADEKYKLSVTCAVICDVVNEEFCLVPLAGELDSLQRDTLAELQEEFREKLPDTTVLLGSPG